MKVLSLLVLFFGCLSVGCNKVLDKKNLSAVSDKDNIWNDLDLSTAYLNKIYADNLPSWSTEWSTYSEEADGGGTYLYGNLTENSVDYWPYHEIRNINILLSNIDNGTLPEADKKSIKGQAIFFRAWRYFEMMKRY